MDFPVRGHRSTHDPKVIGQRVSANCEGYNHPKTETTTPQGIEEVYESTVLVMSHNKKNCVDKSTFILEF